MLTPTDFAPVFVGWNVWSVWAKNDLDFEFMMVGVSNERRLRIWVEDEVRLNAGGTKIADPLDLKGSKVEILPGKPKDLQVMAMRELVGGASVLLLDGPASLYYVRFFNHGAASRLVWPHNENFMLQDVFRPNPAAESTSTPPSPFITDTITDPITDPVKDTAESLGETMEQLGTLILIAGGVYLAVKLIPVVLPAKR